MATPATARLCKAALTLVGVLAVATGLTPGAAHATPSPADLQSQIDAKGRQLDAIVEQFNGATLQLAKTTEQAQAAAAKLGPLQSQADAASAVVAMLAARAYEGGTVSGITSLINAGSPETFLDRLTILRTLGHDQRASVSALREASSAAQDEKSKLDQLLASQNQQKANLAAQRAKIESEIAALERQQASLGRTGNSGGSSGSYTGTPPPVSGRAGVAVRYAYAQLGKPYSWGSAGPNSFDCSGLTMAAWAAAGVQLSHYTGAQLSEAAPISRNQLQPGDLVFFYGGGHVGIYVGSGQVIHAPRPGERVKLVTLDSMNGYYAARRPH